MQRDKRYECNVCFLKRERETKRKREKCSTDRDKEQSVQMRCAMYITWGGVVVQGGFVRRCEIVIERMIKGIKLEYAFYAFFTRISAKKDFFLFFSYFIGRYVKNSFK